MSFALDLLLLGVLDADFLVPLQRFHRQQVRCFVRQRIQPQVQRRSVPGYLQQRLRESISARPRS